MLIALPFLHPVRVTLLTALLLFLPGQLQAQCECIWQGSFHKAALSAELIVSGTIVARKGNAIDMQVTQLVVGKEFRETIRIWGNNGRLCRPSVEDFPLDSQWLFALHRIHQPPEDGFNPNTPNISFGREHDYYLSSCGAYWLAYNNGSVSGNLVNGGRWQYDNKEMNPVLLELVDAYFKGILPEQALIEAAKPQTAAKKLMEETKGFIETQR